MEQMTQELNIDNYDLKSIKKLYNTSCGSNQFLNNYTLQDVETGKKRTFTYLMKKYNFRQSEFIQSFVDSTALVLAKELFQSNPIDGARSNSISTIIQESPTKNVYENHRMINIDSAYRSNLYGINDKYNSYTTSDMTVQLNDTLDNTTSLELTNVCIPFTFYNINADHGNNYFYVKDNSDSVIKKIDINSGNYDTAMIISNINDSLTNNDVSLNFSINNLTNKVSLHVTNDVKDYEIVFYDNSNNSDYPFNPPNTSNSLVGSEVHTKLNNNLGWLLGFRNTGVANYDRLVYLVSDSQTADAEALCHIPYTKYFIIVIDDLNRNQSNRGLVQIKNTKEQIQRKKYFNNIDNSLNCLTDANFDDYANNGLTKNQLFSALQVNNYRTAYSENMSKLSSNLINNVFAIIPFETKSLVWGNSMFTSDKNKYKRKYANPVKISKMNIKLLDDRGNLINLNGAEWSFSMISTHVYNN